MNVKVLAATIIVLVCLGLSVFASDHTYISFDGEFSLNYPESWQQVDHRIVDAFLVRNDAGRSTLDYEATFNLLGYSPFWKGPYFILSVEADGPYSDTQIDSVLQSMSRTFGKGVKYFPVANFMTDMESNSPVYDRERKIISVASDVVEKGELLKKHLLVMKFFEKGMASFYFYAPDSLYDSSSTVFHGILETFTYGNIDSMLAPESLEVVDADDISQDSDGVFGMPLAVLVGLCIVTVVIIARRKKEKRIS